MQWQYTNLEVVLVVQEVESRRSCRVVLLPAASLCGQAPQAAPAVLSTSHTTGRRAPDDQEHTGLPGVLWSDTKNGTRCQFRQELK